MSNTIKYLDKSLFIKPRFPKKEEKKFNELNENDQIKASKALISVNIYTKALLFEIKKLKSLGMLDSYALIIDFIGEMGKLQSYFQKEVLSKNKDNNEIFENKLRAIENIVFMLNENDDLIFRTEKFVTTIKK